MKERPILFQGAMVRALLDGTKTQTRRVAKTEITMGHESIYGPRQGKYSRVYLLDKEHDLREIDSACPYGQPGDRLWVRETHFINDFRSAQVPEDERADCQVVYKADPLPCWEGEENSIVWHPSIHMPRWASRITLEITGVRVERLNDISEADAIAEGAPLSEGGPCPEPEFQSHTLGYWHLWDSINGAGSWAAHPWVWVVEFKVVKP